MTRALAALAAALMTLTLAGCSDADEAVDVTGIVGAPDEEIRGEPIGAEFTEGPCAGHQDYEGNVYRSVWSYGEDSGGTWVSDQRLTGDYEQSMDIDFQDEGDTCVGSITATVTLTNGDGAWEGTVEGTTSWKTGRDHEHDIDYTLTGSGDYEGLKCTFNVYGFAYPWDLTGTISPT